MVCSCRRLQDKAQPRCLSNIRQNQPLYIRDAYIAPFRMRLLARDYKQLEMRILAHFSKDPNLVEIITKGQDVHSGTAAKMFSESYNDIAAAVKKKDDTSKPTLNERELKLLKYRVGAKTINFMLMYGGGAAKLAGILGIKLEEAKGLINNYFTTFNGVTSYFQRTIEHSRTTGNCVTYLGRTRWVPGILSADSEVASAYERKVKNSPIQGCYPSRTKILTQEHGYRSIGDAPVNGTAWTGTTWVPYTKLARGQCQLAELALRNGQRHTCDTRHEVLTETPSGYTFTNYNNLEIGTRVCLSMAKPIEYGVSVDDNLYYWMGYAIGNGSSNQAGGHSNAMNITIGTRKGRYSQIEKVDGLRAWALSHGYNPRVRQVPGKGCCTVTIENAQFRLWWESQGYCWGSNADAKRVPTSVWGASLRGRKEFLLGMLDADGTIGADHVGGEGGANIHLCQRELLAELQQLFRTCGVVSCIRGPYGPTSSWRLDINKGQLVEHFNYGIASKTVVQTPAPPFLVAKFVEATAHVAFPQSSFGTLGRHLRKGSTTSVYTLQTMAQEYGVCLGEIYDVTELVSKRALPEIGETYTLSMDSPLHRFDAEGVIAKNTAADICKMAMLQLYVDPLITNSGIFMVSQVHDEIVFEVPAHLEHDAEVNDRVTDIMAHPFEKPLSVPLETSGSYGDNWKQTK